MRGQVRRAVLHAAPPAASPRVEVADGVLDVDVRDGRHEDPQLLRSLDVRRDRVDGRLQVGDELLHDLAHLAVVARAVVRADHARVGAARAGAVDVLALHLRLVREGLRDAREIVPDVALLVKLGPGRLAVDALVVVRELHLRVRANLDLALLEALEHDLERLELLALGVGVSERAPLMREEDDRIGAVLRELVQLARGEEILVRNPLVHRHQVLDLEAVHRVRRVNHGSLAAVEVPTGFAERRANHGFILFGRLGVCVWPPVGAVVAVADGRMARVVACHFTGQD